MGNSSFFRRAGIAMLVVGAACAVVALMPRVRGAIGCSEGALCEPLLRSGGGIVAATFMLIGGIWFAVGQFGSAAGQRAMRLRRSGATATGQLLEIVPTGTLVNGMPLVDALIRVDAASGAFLVQDRMRLPPGSGLRAGVDVVVHYDPRNPADFVLGDRVPGPDATVHHQRPLPGRTTESP